VRAQIGGWLLAHGWALEGLFWLVIACIVGLPFTLAAGVIRLAWRIYQAVATRMAVRIDGRRVGRWAEYYANHPANRREETP
jgi:biotin transporter BioY